ncbi:MAG TPA: threonine--tRNA ligase [Chloroflexota bacterium]|nr:threonine--tRNA ligase [Chloroflexota bacterium]HZU06869.1 threonine--tRNA ligase [Chloroflexota bacterium]
MPDLQTMRHSAAHVLAAAVQRLFPGTRLGIGPATEQGFYYDLDVPRRLTPEDLAAIEDEMRRLIAAAIPFEREELPIEEAIALFEARGEPYKVELLRDLRERGTTRLDNEEQRDVDPRNTRTASIYRTGDYIDLCLGPHVADTSQIGPFKLLSVAGAYWRGDERRPQLQRIYGTVWPTAEELERYLWRIEEAKRRDHRRLGRELGLFFFDDVAPGQPFILPRGMAILRVLEAHSRREHLRRGYQEISTPSLVKATLWEQSGHWGYYRENMFVSQVEDEQYAFKPMNCPEATIVYRSALRSYRDLPLRLAETSRLLRNERSGTLSGLLRVRQLTMDDAHIFCRPDQIQEEIRGVLEFGRAVYDLFGFPRRYYLSTRPEKAMGDPALWELAERALAEALEAAGIAYEVKPGEGAFYGPKIDVDIDDALGRSWQLCTIQLDFQQPERFNLEYIGEDGQPHRPVMIHRAIYGTYERFLGILVEHYAGAFPLWLAPVQVAVIPVADRHVPYAEEVAARLRAADLRVEVDARNERMQAKIRDAQLLKVPYMLVVGDKEVAAGAVAVRERSGTNLGPMPVDAFLALAQERIAAYQ